MEYLEENRDGRASQSERPRFGFQFKIGKSVHQQLVAGGVVLLLLALWEIGVRLGVISSLLFPAPSAIVRSLGTLLFEKSLLRDLKLTLLRMGGGVVLGGLSGLVLGMVLGRSDTLRSVIDPVIAAAYPIPKIAIFPLIMVFLGIGETSKVFIAGLAAFFPMLINTRAGAQQIHPVHLAVARNYGATSLKVFTRVVLPSSLPYILAGLLLALNTAFLVTIAIEMVTSMNGLGAMIWLSWQVMRTEDLYATLTLIALLGILFNFLVRRLTHYLIPWQS